MYTDLNVAKLAPPRDISSNVHRSRVLARLSEDKFCPLTVVYAPMGFGKTILLAQQRNLLVEQGYKVAWLSLDPDDNDEIVFFRYLHETLRGFGFKDSEIEVYGDANHRLGKVLNWSRSVKETVYIFIENIHFISDPVIQKVIQEFINKTSANFNVYISSRDALPFQLSHAQKRYQTVDANLIKFTYQEVDTLLTKKYQHKPRQEIVEEIFSYTDGWPLAIRIFVNSITEEQIKNVSSVNGLLSKSLDVFIREEVDSCLSQDELDLLTKVSFLESVNEDVCSFIVDQDDISSLLPSIINQQLIFSPIRENPEWYRFRPIFLNYYRDKFTKLSNEKSKSLYKNASLWFSKKRYYSDAVTYAIKAELHDEIVVWIDRSVKELVKDGKFSAAVELVESLSSDKFVDPVNYLLPKAWALSWGNRFTESDKVVSELENFDNRLNIRQKFEVSLIKARTAAYKDDGATLVDEIFKHEKNIPTTNPFLLAVFANLKAYALIVSGRLDESRRFLLSDQQLSSSNGEYIYLLHQIALCLIQVESGDLVGAEKKLREVYVRAESWGGRLSQAACMSATLLADISYETNKLDELVPLLSNKLDYINKNSVIELVIRANYVYVKTLAQQGKFNEAIFILDHMRDVGLQRQSKRLIASSIGFKAQVSLQAGDIEAAKAYENELKQFNLEAINVKNMGTFESRFQHAFVSAKILYAEGHYQGAYDLIEPYAVLAETHERWRFVVRLRTFQAKCFFALNLNWMELIEGVWGVAQKQDMLRSILDEGQDCLAMIKTIDADSCRQIGISMNFLSLLQDALLREVLPGKSDSSAKDRKIKNSLTLTELEIVKLLAKGLANKQIATLLGIGTGTVKWHLHNIYIKLDAPSRRSAVTIAHQSGLLA